jgi:hypothetical protein
LGPGQLKAPDYRGLIKQDMDLLDRLPPEATARRADLQHTIDVRIDDLVAATHQSRALREAAASYRGNWRDVVLFVCTVCSPSFGGTSTTAAPTGCRYSLF